VTRLVLASLAATEALAVRIAGLARPPDVVALRGGLGAGKTSFARLFIAARAGRPLEVPSPTFTLVQSYDLPGGTIWHFDLFRLKLADEAWELGIEQAFADGISLIEWPERLGALLPEDRLDLTLEPGATPDSRVATLEAHGSWRDRL
jgi:tRNA threonylcarbamoyladenosine biosynthesis protein TsaE